VGLRRCLGGERGGERERERERERKREREKERKRERGPPNPSRNASGGVLPERGEEWLQEGVVDALIDVHAIVQAAEFVGRQQHGWATLTHTHTHNKIEKSVVKNKFEK
jgi:hypothetical protein